MTKRLVAPAVTISVLFASLAGGMAASAAPPKCFGRSPTIVGTNGGELIEGTAARDVIAGLGGRDRILAMAGDDLVCSGEGGTDKNPEIALGGDGTDVMRGGSGTDHVLGGKGPDAVWGGSGRDLLTGSRGMDRVAGGQDSDSVKGGNGDDGLYGGVGSDVLNGEVGSDHLVGGANGIRGDVADYGGALGGVRVDLQKDIATGIGRDTLHGIEGAYGSDGNDHMIGDSRQNVFLGLGGFDNLRGGKKGDCLNPGTDENQVFGGSGFDNYSANSGFYAECEHESIPGSVIGGPFSPSITVDLAAGTAESSSETTELHSVEGVYGTYGADHLMGDALRNFLLGGPGRDMIEGRGLSDTLDGAGSYDSLDGGMGADECLHGEIVINCES